MNGTLMMVIFHLGDYIGALTFLHASHFKNQTKLYWSKSFYLDLKDWDISEELALDRSAWRVAINVPEP